MAPEKLRQLSLRTFKATVYCGIAGFVVILAIPNPGFKSAASLAARIIAISGFSLVGIALLTNLVSLVSGAVAWTRGAGQCSWIILSAILLLIPVAFILILML